jgi:hypothetical protein
MVTQLATAVTLGMLLSAVDKAALPVLERLDPPRRAAVVMALLGLTLIGLFLIVLAMLGGHWARRLARHRPGKSAKGSRLAEARDTQLRQSLQSILPEAKTDDTTQFGKSSPETRIGG